MMDKSLTTPFEKALSFGLLTAALLTGRPKADAQAISKTPPVQKGAHEVLAIFETKARSGQGSAPDLVRHPEKYPRARVDSVINGLESLALTAKSESVGTSAAAALGMAGAAERALPGLLDRALRVYRRSSNTAVRATIVHYMYDQSDRRRAIAFLKSVAVQDSAQQDFDGAPFIAAMVLSEMAEDGRTVLLELRDKNLLRDPRTAGFVDWFLRNK